MALQQHLAPRIIQARGFCGDPIQITRSLLQGCICSVGFTRAYLMNDMSYLANKFPEADPTVYVDDSTCDTAQESFEEVLDVLVPYSVEFARRMQGRSLPCLLKELFAATL